MRKPAPRPPTWADEAPARGQARALAQAEAEAEAAMAELRARGPPPGAAEALADPLVAAIMRAWPGTEIVSITNGRNTTMPDPVTTNTFKRAEDAKARALAAMRERELDRALDRALGLAPITDTGSENVNQGAGFYRKDTTMPDGVDPWPREAARIEAAGARGGKYLDHLNVTDLTRLSTAQWNRFVGEVIAGYREATEKERLPSEKEVAARGASEPPPF
jgi:hypothetical protein